MRVMSMVLVLAMAGPVLADPALESDAAQVILGGDDVMDKPQTTAGLRAWIADFRPRALAQGIAETTLERAFDGLEFNATVIERDRNQGEFTKTIWDYLDKAVSDIRIDYGQKAMAKHAALLAQIEARYGVEKEVVVAIWGLESSYGANRGDIAVIGALATLAYDTRRADFFEQQLIAALKIVQNGDVVPAQMLGSWAGAMGHTQFMPTSFLAFAEDFTGDGRRDIWGEDPADALASTAAYLAKSGWQKGRHWGLEVTLPASFDYEHSGDRVVKPVAEWAALGVAPAQGGALPPDGPAALRLPAGAKGAAFLTFANFQAIEKYNAADAYVIAIGHLADRLRGGPAIKADWPRDDRALQLPERLELQTLLAKAGHDAGGVDGKMGPNTLAAIKSFQRAQGMLTDGFPNPALLDVLRKVTQ